ncbi:MAG: HEAT repeat domain-containing protein [Pseudomonadota bacterium]|nr:MAG: HEAT repeat domain-containing protein [Pseudomonadota bacterium]
MGLYKQIEEADVEQLLTWWDTAPDWAEHEEYPFVLDEIAHTIVLEHPEHAQLLRTHARSGDTMHRAAAISALAWTPELFPELEAGLAEAFAEDSVELKTRALWGAIDAGLHPFDREVIADLKAHADPRLAALSDIYLAYTFPEERIAVLTRCLASENPRCREYACDAVGDLEVTELRSTLEKLRDDPDEGVRAAAEANLG